MTADKSMRDFEDAARRQCPGINCVVVSRQREVVYSHCFKRQVSHDTPAEIYSITKSVLSVVAGIAAHQRCLPPLETTLAEVLSTSTYQPQLVQQAKQRQSQTAHPGAPAIGKYASALSLHQLLSMTSGIAWPHNNYGLEPLLGRVTQSRDWVEQLLKLPISPSLAGQFSYNTGLSHLLSCAISSVVKEPVDKFAARHLFTPLGINEYQWPRDPQNYSFGGWGLHLSANALLRLGELCINDGVYHGTQLLPRQWLQDSFFAHTPDYGYHWWLDTWRGTTLIVAKGLGGQLLYLVPEKDAVIVVTVSQRRRVPTQTLAKQYLLPLIYNG